MIPRGIKVIFVINLILLMLAVVLLYFSSAVLHQFSPVALFVLFTTTGGLFLLQTIIVLRWKRLLPFIRLLIYVLAILQGLMALLLIRDVFSVFGIFLVLLAVLHIAYFIGVRGYLGSPAVARYFGNDTAE